MEAADIVGILDAYLSGEDQDGVGEVPVKLVDVSDIGAAGWDLNISRYLAARAGEVVDVETALGAFRDAQEALRQAEHRLDERLKEAGHV